MSTTAAANAFFIQRKIDAALRDMDQAQARVLSAKTIPDLARALSGVHPDPLIRSLPQVRAAKTRLERLAEERAQKFGDALLAKLAAASPGEETEKVRAAVRAASQACRGRFPREVRRLDRALI